MYRTTAASGPDEDRLNQIKGALGSGPRGECTRSGGIAAAVS